MNRCFEAQLVRAAFDNIICDPGSSTPTTHATADRNISPIVPDFRTQGQTSAQTTICVHCWAEYPSRERAFYQERYDYLFIIHGVHRLIHYALGGNEVYRRSFQLVNSAVPLEEISDPLHAFTVSVNKPCRVNLVAESPNQTDQCRLSHSFPLILLKHPN